jgi:hypothetical protein
LWKNSFVCYLTKSENDRLSQRNIKYSLESREEELLFEYYSPADSEDEENAQWLKISDILKKLETSAEYRVTNNSHTIIGKALAKHTVKQKRSNTSRYYLLKTPYFWMRQQ